MASPSIPGRDPRERRRARARRIALIRRRVAATALATFVLAFGVIARTGSMGSETSATATAQASTTTTTTADDSADTLGSVTTRQS